MIMLMNSRLAIKLVCLSLSLIFPADFVVYKIVCNHHAGKCMFICSMHKLDNLDAEGSNVGYV